MISSRKFYIGWDVGGWNCDRGKSRDAIVILDADKEILGKPWWGNLRELINTAPNSGDFLRGLFRKCEAESLYHEGIYCVLAIDTPLGYSENFLDLVHQGKAAQIPVGKHSDNPYLFRETELHLYGKGYKPLSAVKDMIGSQSTKGIHVLAKYGLTPESTGVWTNKKKSLHVIETYPSLHRELVKHPDNKARADIKDAYSCAEIARIFDMNRSELVPADESASKLEGWIWYLKSVPNRAK